MFECLRYDLRIRLQAPVKPGFLSVGGWEILNFCPPRFMWEYTHVLSTLQGSFWSSGNNDIDDWTSGSQIISNYINFGMHYTHTHCVYYTALSISTCTILVKIYFELLKDIFHVLIQFFNTILWDVKMDHFYPPCPAIFWTRGRIKVTSKALPSKTGWRPANHEPWSDLVGSSLLVKVSMQV